MIVHHHTKIHYRVETEKDMLCCMCYGVFYYITTQRQNDIECVIALCDSTQETYTRALRYHTNKV